MKFEKSVHFLQGIGQEPRH